MFLKKEKYTDDNGIEHIVSYYGKDMEHISGTIDEPIVEDEPVLPTMSETEEAILNTNANVEYLVALKELEV